MVLDKCLLVWLFLLDRLNAICVCLIIKIKAQCSSFCLIQSGLSGVCLSLHNDLAVFCFVSCFLMVFCNCFFTFQLFLIELIKPTGSDLKSPLSLSVASTLFHCVIELLLADFCPLSFGICSLVSSVYSVGDFFYFLYQDFLLSLSSVYQMT